MSDEIQIQILRELKKITEILLCEAEERDMERVTKKRLSGTAPVRADYMKSFDPDTFTCPSIIIEKNTTIPAKAATEYDVYEEDF